jgi:hypothetical protein
MSNMTDIQKGNLIKPIFLLSFIKWLGSNHPWIYCDNMTFNEVHLQVEMIDEKIKELTDDLKTGRLHLKALRLHRTALRIDVLLNLQNMHSRIKEAIDKFFKLNIIYVVYRPYDDDSKSDISLLLDYKLDNSEFRNVHYIRQLNDFLISLTGERLLSGYDPTYEYYFNESLFNELFSFIYQVYLVQFRNVVLQYT